MKRAWWIGTNIRRRYRAVISNDVVGANKTNKATAWAADLSPEWVGLATRIEVLSPILAHTSIRAAFGRRIVIICDAREMNAHAQARSGWVCRPTTPSAESPFAI